MEKELTEPIKKMKIVRATDHDKLTRQSIRHIHTDYKKTKIFVYHE